MRPFSIPTRILLAFVLMTLGFVSVAFTSVRQHNRTARDLGLLQNGYLPLAKVLIEVKSNQEMFRYKLARVAGGDQTALGLFRAGHQLRPGTLRVIENRLALAERLAARADRADGLVRVREAFEEIRGL